MPADIKPFPGLYLITDRSRTLDRPLTEVVRAALDGGVRMVQLREKDMGGRELFELAGELRALTNQYGARLLINDRIDVALAVGADGVHLGNKSISVQDARRAVEASSLISDPSSFIIGVSTHSIEEALVAQSDGADLLTFGPVHFTPSKASYGGPVGIDRLKEAADTVKLPIYALGGINRGNVGAVMNAGACGVSMISAIMAADDVKKASEDMLKAITDHRLQTTVL